MSVCHSSTTLPSVRRLDTVGSAIGGAHVCFMFSPVCVTRGHPYKLFVPRTVVNTRKHYFCVRVIEPRNNLNCATVDFS